MEILNLLQNLEESTIFQEWRESNPDDYLVNLFKFVQDGSDSFWQIGYYNKKTDMITTFNIEETITINPPSEVFKKEGAIDRLKVELVNIDSDEALRIAKEFQESNHPYDPLMKTIVLIQNKDDNQVYNITFITQTLKTLNIKVSCVDGKIIDSKMTSLMDFKRD